MAVHSNIFWPKYKLLFCKLHKQIALFIFSCATGIVLSVYLIVLYVAEAWEILISAYKFV
jgi:hypothetical protein